MPTCSFWNEDNDAWSSDGCTLAWASSSHIGCRCTHATDFAGLFEARLARLNAVIGGIGSVSTKQLMDSLHLVIGISVVVIALFCWLAYAARLDYLDAHPEKASAKVVPVPSDVEAGTPRARPAASEAATLLVSMSTGVDDGTPPAAESEVEESVVITTLEQHGMRDPDEGEGLVSTQRRGCGQWCHTIGSTIWRLQLQGHPWLRIMFNVNPYVTRSEQVMLLMTVTVSARCLAGA